MFLKVEVGTHSIDKDFKAMNIYPEGGRYELLQEIYSNNPFAINAPLLQISAYDSPEHGFGAISNVKRKVVVRGYWECIQW